MRPEARQRVRRVDRVDRRVNVVIGWPRVPLRHLEPAGQEPIPAAGPNGQLRGGIRLLKAVVDTVLLRRVGANAVEADFGRIAPPSEDRERQRMSEEFGSDELRLDALVSAERDAAADIEGVIGADVFEVAGAEREAAAGVCAVEERMKPAPGRER